MNSKRSVFFSRQLVAGLFTLISTLFITPTMQAQEQVAPNNLVKAALTESEIAGIMSADPNSILYYNYLTEEAWFVIEGTGDKAGEMALHDYLYRMDRKTKIVLPQALSAEDLPTFNLLQYDFKISETRNYYRIANSNKILVIKSHNEIIAGVNQFKK
jgi:hypothetical protein